MGVQSGAAIEPDVQTEVCNATMTLPGVVLAGVPGGTESTISSHIRPGLTIAFSAGGMDALFAVVLGSQAQSAVCYFLCLPLFIFHLTLRSYRYKSCGRSEGSHPCCWTRITTGCAPIRPPSSRICASEVCHLLGSDRVARASILFIGTFQRLNGVDLICSSSRL